VGDFQLGIFLCWEFFGEELFRFRVGIFRVGVRLGGNFPPAAGLDSCTTYHVVSH